MMKEEFSTYHPLVNFLYFAMVIGFSMVFTHPACLLISITCALAYSIYINRKKAVRFNLLYMLPMFAATALINPAFNHEGGTILMYLRDGNPLTLESILYGISAASIMISVITWFSCFNAVISSDKFVYLFGRIIPALSLVLSMALRLVPRFKAQIKVISNAQKCVGRDVSNGGIMQRAKNGIRILSVMVTWALENAIETADSMKSRGYGLKGRSAFSLYRFDRRDAGVTTIIMLCGAYVVAGYLTGGLYWRYFPTAKGRPLDLYAASIYIAYFLLCITPVIINVREGIKWRRLRQKI